MDEQILCLKLSLIFFNLNHLLFRETLLAHDLSRGLESVTIIKQKKPQNIYSAALSFN